MNQGSKLGVPDQRHSPPGDERRGDIPSWIDALSSPMVVVDGEGTIQQANAAMTVLRGVPRESLLGTNVADLSPNPEVWLGAIADVVESQAPRIFRSHLVQGDDRVVPVIVNAAMQRSDNGAPRHVWLIAYDVSERRAQRARVEIEIQCDPLTGLPNRAYFTERLRTAQTGGDATTTGVAILFVDLNRFKLVNDGLGHMTGDTVLADAARRLRSVIPPGAMVARFGGDEFVVLLEGLASADEATQVGNGIVAAFREPFLVAGHEVFVTASVGIALGTPPVDNGEVLVRRADIAMYRAKRSGSEHAVLFDPNLDQHRPAHERLTLESDLRRALDREEFCLFYQPKVAVPTAQAYGMEALIRWRHPRLGLLGPIDFIPLAEQIGLIVPIGRWVLGEACRQMRAWKDRFPAEPLSWVSVNLSARQFADPRLIDDVLVALEEADLPPYHLELEITEAVAMTDVAASRRSLDGLRAFGVEVAIDDFGSGYSSLAYLKRLPVTRLKIDRSFVANVTEERDQAIIAAILQLARALDLKTTAEGVETVEQLAALRRLGCPFAQGFYFARPLPPDRAAAYFERDRAVSRAHPGAPPG